MSKIKCLISACPDTFSGYGARSRDLILSLIRIRPDWEINVVSQRWGSTPFGFLNKDNVEHKKIIDRIVHPSQVKEQPDVFIMISVPNEMQPFGKWNVIITAGIETDIAPAEFIEGANRSDLVIVSSEHSKQVMNNTKWTKHDEQTKRPLGDVKLLKSIETLFEGVDTDVYHKNYVNQFDLSEIKEEFAYLAVGHALQGFEHLQDRKMLGVLIKTFLETFKNKKQRPALILKTALAGYSIVEEMELKKKIDMIRKTVSGDLPNIYLIHGELEDHEMALLYNHPKVKAFVLVGNEGFGRPYLEFSATSGKPIIASPWSGHLDFLEKEYNLMVSGDLSPVGNSAVNNFIVQQSKWFYPNQAHLSDMLQSVYQDYNKYVENGKRQGYRSRTKFSIAEMDKRFDEILKKHMPKISTQVNITLPKLTKLSLPETK